MANVIKKSTNRWTKGLVMDFSPENTSNEVLTHALNATLLTFNGNELSLQSDMGNARVETAYLPEGYIPVGTCEYGGIIYIVSYNPLEDKSQIGCFPSPERNVSSDELGKMVESIKNADFVYDGDIINSSKLVILKDNPLNPGDKFIVTANKEIYEQSLADLYTFDGKNFNINENPIIALNLVSISDSGKITYLNSDIIKYDQNIGDTKYKYHILGSNKQDTLITKEDIDSYRNVVSSGYSVFKQKTSGKLAILAELIMVDSCSVTHKIIPDDNKKDWYNLVLHIETSSENAKQKYGIIPQLSCYYLEKSQGYIPYSGNSVVASEILVEQGKRRLRTLFDKNQNTKVFTDTALKDVYDVSTLLDIYKDKTFASAGFEFNFPSPNTYHVEKLMTFGNDGYTRLLKKHVMSSGSLGSLYPEFNSISNDFYIYKTESESFIAITIEELKEKDDLQIIFVYPEEPFTTEFIENYDEDIEISKVELSTIVEKEIVCAIKIADYLNNDRVDNVRVYEDLKLATFKINKDIPLLMEYKYTLVPCMNYGKLNHLAVSNSINFQNLFDFKKSKFTEWRYRVDGNQVRLTFGTEIYDTNTQHGEVVGIVLEFYDHLGFAGSLIIKDRQSYSGTFTKVLTLNSLNALSNKKLVPGSIQDQYSLESKYARNITIAPKDDKTGQMGNTPVYWNSSTGWTTDEAGLSPVESDCGILYPNIVYGVKPYLLQKGDDDTKYRITGKEQMFLFTSPLLNEYYYDKKNFNLIEDPQLQLVMTYKITDESSITDITSAENVGDENMTKLNEYTSGTFSETQLQTKKYLQYDGVSKLQVEVGLKQDYDQLGFSYNPDINQKFGCTLYLSDDAGSGVLDVKSNNSNYTDPSEILGYSPESNISNKIGFGTSTMTAYKANYTCRDIYNFGFMNIKGNDVINIYYSFNVCHDINIKDIQKTFVPATTVCALYHKQDDGTYNYKDFGINFYKDSSDNEYYYSNAIFYNSGTNEEVEFGLCKLVSPNGDIMTQCQKVMEEYYDASKKSVSTQPNTGAPLKSLSSKLSKLAFISPYACGFSNDSGVNVCIGDDQYPGSNQYLNYSLWITPDFESNDIVDMVPTRYLYNNPRYLTCLNTKVMVDQQGEFVVTMEHNYDKGVPMNTFIISRNKDNWDDDSKAGRYTDSNKTAKEFIGLTAPELGSFNKTMLKTMKQVYAYNPDYDKLGVNQGQVFIKNTQCKFTSNLLSKDSQFIEPIDFNEYINFCGVQVSTYLENMEKYSGNEIIVKYIETQEGGSEISKWIPQINFNPDLTYCGTKTMPALLTTLTYNIPEPKTIYDELTFNVSPDEIIVRKENGDIKRIKGELNKKALYTYKEDSNQLIQLDVSNYRIDRDGYINLTDKILVHENTDNRYQWTQFTCTGKENKSVVITPSIETQYNYIHGNNNKLVCVESDKKTNKIQFNVDPDENIEALITLKISSIHIDKIGINDDYPETTTQYVNIFRMRDQEFSSMVSLITNASGTMKCVGGSYTSMDEKIITPDISNAVFNNHELINDYDDKSEFTYTKKTNSIKLQIKSNEPLEFSCGKCSDQQGILILIEIENIQLRYTTDCNYGEESIVNITNPINDYYNTPSILNDYKYSVYYDDKVLIGTSITLNDLYYEPNINGHRLFANPKYIKYRTYPRGKVYYRQLKPNDDGTHPSWSNDTDGYNTLYLHTGPCFLPEPLHQEYWES